MAKDIAKEIDEMAEKMTKSIDPKEVLFETITNLGPEGLRARLPFLSDDEKFVLKSAIEEMTLKKAKSVEFDKEAQGAKHIQGNIMDTVIQEEVGNDDADEKLVKPEAAKHSHQGNSVEGWEGQVIKAEEYPPAPGKDIKEEEKEQEIATNRVGKYKQGKDMKKSFEGVSEETILKAICKMCEQGKKKEEIEERLESKAGMPKEKAKKLMEKAMKMQEAAMKIAAMEEKEHGTKNPKKLVEDEAKEQKAKKEEMKTMKKSDHDSGKILAEEDQLGDTDQMTEESKDLGDDSQDPAKANKQAQASVNNMKVEMKKSVSWAPEDRLLKANTQGRNFTFNVADFVEEMLKAEEKMKAKKDGEEQAEDEEKEKMAKMPMMKMKKSEINDLIEKSMDKSQNQEDSAARLAAQSPQTGRLVKSFNETTDLAALLGLSEEEAKKILG